MNLLHRRYCRSRRWRGHLRELLPRATEQAPLADLAVGLRDLGVRS